MLIRDETEVTKRIERMQAQQKKLEEDDALSRKRVDTMVLTEFNSHDGVGADVCDDFESFGIALADAGPSQNSA